MAKHGAHAALTPSFCLNEVEPTITKRNFTTSQSSTRVRAHWQHAYGRDQKPGRADRAHLMNENQHGTSANCQELLTVYLPERVSVWDLLYVLYFRFSIGDPFLSDDISRDLRSGAGGARDGACPNE